MHGEGLAAHVLAIEEEGPPGRLLDKAVGAGHEGGDDVDGLGDVGHAYVLGLADEDVEPDCYGEGVGEVVPVEVTVSIPGYTPTYSQVIRRGMAYFSSAPSSPGARTGSQTFHSSKQIFCLRIVGGTLFSARARSINPAAI